MIVHKTHFELSVTASQICFERRLECQDKRISPAKFLCHFRVGCETKNRKPGGGFRSTNFSNLDKTVVEF